MIYIIVILSLTLIAVVACLVLLLNIGRMRFKDDKKKKRIEFPGEDW